MAVAACEKSGIKNDSCWANPRNDLTGNDLTPVRFVGFGKFVMARILSVSYTHLTLPTIYSV